MIKTDIDVKDELYAWIKTSSLITGENKVSGTVYKDQRPLNSDKEDIIISVLSRTADSQIQDFIVNVNVYVKDSQRAKETVEDTPRIRTLSRLSANLFEYRNTGNMKIALSAQEVFKANDIPWHVINNRLNISYNNE